MSKQSINIGSTANDDTGDNPRAAAIKINSNADELYAGIPLQIPLTTPSGGKLVSGDTIPFKFPPWAGTVASVTVYAKVAPTTSAATFDVLKASSWGGTLATILTADISLAASSNSQAGTLDGAEDDFSGGEQGEVEITGVDTGETCADALIEIIFNRT